MTWICKKNLSSLRIRQSLSFVLYFTESEHIMHSVRLKQPVNPIKKKTSGDVIVFSYAGHHCGWHQLASGTNKGIQHVFENYIF